MSFDTAEPRIQLPKLNTGVRFPSPAPSFTALHTSDDGIASGAAESVGNSNRIQHENRAT
jgi:hypothetical protein